MAGSCPPSRHSAVGPVTVRLDPTDQYATLFPPEPAASRRPTVRARTPAIQRALVVAIAAAAAAAAVLAPGEAAGSPWSDAVVRAGFGAMVALAGSRARRSTWLWVSGVAVIGAPSAALAVLALGALALAVVDHLMDRRARVDGAIVAAVSIQVLLRLGEGTFFGFTALLAAVAVAPLLTSAYLVSPRRVKRRVQRTGAVVGVVLLVGLVSFVVSTAVASQRVEEGIANARLGLTMARAGNDEGATERLLEAARALDEANGALDGWWARPARAVPLLGHQARAASLGTAEGRDLAAVAARATGTVPVAALEFEDGRIDLDLVVAAAGPLGELAEMLATVDHRLAGADGGWVLPPFSTHLHELRAAVDEALPDARTAAAVAEAAPGLLGGDGLRRYLVLFTTPAETRGLGGFVGSWAELTALNGKVSLARSGRIQELRDASPGASRSLTSTVDGQRDQRMVEYLDRYRIRRPWDALQDVTLSPDLPTVAEAWRQLYPQVGGQELDGVMVLDPIALAALMELTGPVTLDAGVTIDSAEAAQFLLVDQYELVDRENREHILEEAGRLVFERLTTGSVPNPRRVADRVAPMVAQGRLAATSFHEDEQALFAVLGATGSMTPPGAGDAFGLITTNTGQNKIDVYLERSVDYRAQVDADSGALAATATVTLRNGVPGLDLPDAVVGSNDQGLPRGTNELLLSFYTPWFLVGGTVDGRAPDGFEAARELGYWVWSTRVAVPAGEEVVVELHLEGTLADPSGYGLEVHSQPLVRPDAVRVEVEARGGRFGPADGVALDDGARRATVTFPGIEATSLYLDLRRR
jgi:hypothetical protein